MLEKAFKQIPDGTNLILHSDQGWQYQMYDYQRPRKKKKSDRACPGKGIKVKLKGLTPLQFRNQSLKSAWLKCPIIGVHFKISVFYSRILDKLHFHRVQLRIMGICLFVFLLQIPGLLRLHRL